MAETTDINQKEELLHDEHQHSDVGFISTEIDGCVKSKFKRVSEKHFTHRNQHLRIDFVLAANNLLEDLPEEQNIFRRRTFFNNLRKKHLKISSPYLSHVSRFYILSNRCI